MELVKRNSSNGLFPSLMEELFRPDWAGGQNLTTNRSVPPVNIRETDNAYEVELSAPGNKKEDFNINVENDLLTISSQFSENKTEEVGKYTRREFSFSAFQRSFTLPETVKDDDIKATYEDGILKITLPKKEEALPKPKRTIEIF
ncbi:Hsp20/alpha crystallin family protein [Flavobacterium soli]|uniref:Hsp20/alpha crystallin family protein n=1 Tax=Flavobacterium soli TaxID=344881 RepID=UPI0004267A65|nr:Hsp20/alpha crystallin family protein [Flavobacterium soli]